jgi:hypothetical protein
MADFCSRLSSLLSVMPVGSTRKPLRSFNVCARGKFGSQLQLRAISKNNACNTPSQLADWRSSEVSQCWTNSTGSTVPNTELKARTDLFGGEEHFCA